MRPGRRGRLPRAYWVTYPEAIALAGGVPKVIETTEETGFRVTVDQLEAARTERTKAVLFVSPDNPTGAVYPAEEVEAIAWWALRHGIWVITDEIYEHLTYGPHEFTSMPTLVADIADQYLVLNGVAKTYAMTGWRVGWMIGPKDVIKAATNLQSHSTSNVCNVAQKAALAAVTGDLEAVAMMRAAFERRGRTMQTMLSEIPGVSCLEPQGAFYCFPSFERLLGKPGPRTAGSPGTRWSSPMSSSRRPAWRWCPARPSERRATPACRSPWRTRNWKRACAASNSCSAEQADERGKRLVRRPRPGLAPRQAGSEVASTRRGRSGGLGGGHGLPRRGDHPGLRAVFGRR